MEKKIYEVIVDYKKTINQMVSRGNYDTVAGGFSDQLFKLMGKGQHAFNLVIISVKEILEWLDVYSGTEQFDVTTKQVNVYMSNHGLSVASVEHLLAFGATYPEMQMELDIVALGNVSIIPILVNYGPELGRGLTLMSDEFEGDWSERFNFLAISK